MSRKTVSLVILGLIVLAALGFYSAFFFPQKNSHLAERRNPEQSANDQPQEEQVKPELEEPIEELSLDGEELELYFAVYKNPFVTHVRKALDGYLAGTNVGIGTPEVTIPDLAAFDRSYYESKFVVMSVYDALFGGREISLIFQDKPDRIFTAWVYWYEEDDRYDLWGFWEHKEGTRDINNQLKRYRKFIFDKEHSL